MCVLELLLSGDCLWVHQVTSAMGTALSAAVAALYELSNVLRNFISMCQVIRTYLSVHE